MPLSNALWTVLEVVIGCLVFCSVFAFLGRARTESYFNENPGSAFITAFLSWIVRGSRPRLLSDLVQLINI